MAFLSMSCVLHVFFFFKKKYFFISIISPKDLKCNLLRNFSTLRQNVVFLEWSRICHEQTLFLLSTLYLNHALYFPHCFCKMCHYLLCQSALHSINCVLVFSNGCFTGFTANSKALAWGDICQRRWYYVSKLWKSYFTHYRAETVAHHCVLS